MLSKVARQDDENFPPTKKQKKSTVPDYPSVEGKICCSLNYLKVLFVKAPWVLQVPESTVYYNLVENYIVSDLTRTF